jgi:hypothetical protein
MKQSGKTSLFALVCIAALLGAYGVGLGIRNMRLAGALEQVSATAETEKPAVKPDTDDDEVVADAEASYEPAEELAEESYEEPAERFVARGEPSGRGSAQMVVVGAAGSREMREQAQSRVMEERARRELQAKRAKTDEDNYRRVQEAWPSLDEETRGKISGIIERWPNMSEKERDYYRAGNIE